MPCQKLQQDPIANCGAADKMKTLVSSFSRMFFAIPEGANGSRKFHSIFRPNLLGPPGGPKSEVAHRVWSGNGAGKSLPGHPRLEKLSEDDVSKLLALGIQPAKTNQTVRVSL